MKKLHIKSISLALAMTAMLTGCAFVSQHQSLQKNCATSRVLIANLTPAAEKRPVQLPGGAACPDEAAA